MSVYTISRKLGSGGSFVGRELAVRLGYDYVNRHHLSRMMKDYGFGNFDRIYEELPKIRDWFDENREKTISFLVETIVAVAHHGNIIISGRGSFALLNGFRDIVNIRVKAPMAYRIHRIMAEEDLPREEAEKIIVENDKLRRNFVESDLRLPYADSGSLDLILDTSVMAPETCVEWLVRAHESSEGKRDDERPSIKDVKIDPVLEKHVRSMLKIFRENPDFVIQNRR